MYIYFQLKLHFSLKIYTRECDELRNKRTSLEVNLREEEQVYKNENVKYREMIGKKKFLEAKQEEHVSRGEKLQQLNQEITSEYYYIHIAKKLYFLQQYNSKQFKYVFLRFFSRITKL